MSMAIIFFYFRMLRILWPGDVAIRTALAGCGRGIVAIRTTLQDT